ncbi:MAG: hypothetical protein RSA01_02750 [Clostridium sp.]|uniref:hypothetical protein n=1 Tax=Clostridium sp. TaxID=1506 RepID=UPI002FC744B2
MSRRRGCRSCWKWRLAPALCLIGVGMVLSILIPFWLWILVGGLCLISYGFWSFFC